MKIKTGSVVRSLFLLAIAGTALATLTVSGSFWYFSKGLPKIITVADYRPAIPTQVVASHGEQATVIGEYHKGERRYLIPADQMPPRVIDAFVAAEDDSFFQHQGVNLASIIRAFIANVRAGRTVQGGSTITQQVAKSLLLTPEKSYVRKIKELILSHQMEKNLSKKEILYLYLNQIYLGHGAYGIQAAAKTFFNKDVAELTIAEAALIAGMPQAPGKFSPHQNPEKAKQRQVYVLNRLYETKKISKAELDAALEEKLKIYENTDPTREITPYYAEHLRRYLIEKYGEAQLYQEGMTVIVKADPVLMKKAGEVLRDGLRTIDRRSGYRGPVRKLKGDAEIQDEISKQRNRLIMKELGFEALMPNGKLDTLEALKLGGFQSESELLKLNSIYLGVVTSFDEKSRSAGVMIGVTKVELPLEGLRWARYGLTQPSQVLSRGDVIQVRIVKKEGSRIQGSLEQDPEAQAALFSMDVRSGQVLAMEGGFDFRKSEFNRATQAQRQVGSAYKPLIFTAALEKGFTPASVIVDSPIVYDDKEAGKWKPANFEEKFYGDTSFRMALIKSRNIPTIKIVQEVGVRDIIDFSRRVGMTGSLANDLSLSLGSSTITLEEMVRVYSVFPRMGRKISPIYFSVIKDRDGKVLEEQNPAEIPTPEVMMERVRKALPDVSADTAGTPQTQGRKMPLLPPLPLSDDPDQVMDPRIAYVATHLMKEVVSHGTGHEAKALGKPAAGKTGTTNDYLDAWFMGFTPGIVTGVWVGYDTQKPIGSGETGAKAALPIWLEFMKEAVKSQTDGDFPVPPGVVFASIHPQTGKLAPPNASYAIREAFVEGTEPSESDAASGPVQTRSTGDFLKEDIQ